MHIYKKLQNDSFCGFLFNVTNNNIILYTFECFYAIMFLYHDMGTNGL